MSFKRGSTVHCINFQEDEELLANEQPLSVNRKHAVILRVEEKLIIGDNIAFIEQQLASISRQRTEL